VIEFRKARDLARDSPGLLQHFERELRLTEHQARISPRLPAVLRGEDQPKDAESLAFAIICHNFKRFSNAARLFGEAFRADPKLAEDMQAQNRYYGACAAALAGGGQGKDEPPPDEVAKTQWRRQAIEWLKADLATLSKQLASGKQPSRDTVVKNLKHWKADTDLAGIRDQAALAKLPPEEREDCQALWVEVDAVLRRAQTGEAPRTAPTAEMPGDVFAS
jgi:serine/threonine-protein kinase